MKNVHFCIFEKEIDMLMYCLQFILQIYMCKYCEIDKGNDDMYI